MGARLGGTAVALRHIMKKPTLSILTLSLLTVSLGITLVGVPLASADTITLEATEVVRGKAKARHVFTAELSKQRTTDLRVRNRDLNLDFQIGDVDQKAKRAGTSRAFRFKIEIGNKERDLELQSDAVLKHNVRQLVGKLSSGGSNWELALVMKPSKP